MKHIAVVPMAIKAFLVSAAFQFPFMLMQSTHSRIWEVIGTLYFIPSMVILERLPPTFHLFRNARESTMLSYLIEVDTFQFVMVSAVIFGILVVGARLSLKRKASWEKTPSEKSRQQYETQKSAAFRGRRLEGPYRPA